MQINACLAELRNLYSSSEESNDTSKEANDTAKEANKRGLK